DGESSLVDQLIGIESLRAQNIPYFLQRLVVSERDAMFFFSKTRDQESHTSSEIGVAFPEVNQMRANRYPVSGHAQINFAGRRRFAFRLCLEMSVQLCIEATGKVGRQLKRSRIRCQFFEIVCAFQHRLAVGAVAEMLFHAFTHWWLQVSVEVVR